MPAIDQLMEETGTKPEELDRIAVAHGPGSYTGVRIGLTTAKTMAWALGIPVVGISSLEAVARQGAFFNGYVCPFFDARRGLVYTGLYDSSMTVVMEETNILMEDWLNQLKELTVLFFSLVRISPSMKRGLKRSSGKKRSSRLLPTNLLVHPSLQTSQWTGNLGRCMI